MKEKNFEDLFFTDDYIFCKVMSENESICRRVVELLLGIEVGKLTYLNKQEEMRPEYSSHGIRLDVIAKDTGKLYDIEMQTTIRGNLPKRARYYQAIMDIDNLEKGADYSVLPDSYIVFICLEDPFGGRLPRYTVKSTCLEDAAMNKKVDDKILKVYYNASEWQKLADKDSEIRAFLRFLKTEKPETTLTEDIMEQVMYIRGQEPWRVEFMQERERRQDAYNEGVADARAEYQAQLEESKVEIEQTRAEYQARIAELEAELAKYKNAAQK